jgi:hypothetical protein
MQFTSSLGWCATPGIKQKAISGQLMFTFMLYFVGGELTRWQQKRRKIFKQFCPNLLLGHEKPESDPVDRVRRGLPDQREPPRLRAHRSRSVHDKCQRRTNARTWQMPVHDKCPYMTNARTWQMPVHDKCQCMTNTRAGQMPAQDKCPYMTNAHTGQNVSAWQMSVHDKCPHMTTALTWQLPSHDKCPYMTNVSAWQMPVHDKCQCITNGGCGQIGLNFRNRKYHPNANICYFSKNVNPSRGHGRAQH